MKKKFFRNAVDEVLYAIKHKTTLTSGLMQAFIYLVEHTFMHSLYKYILFLWHRKKLLDIRINVSSNFWPLLLFFVKNLDGGRNLP